ncbi:MAG: 2-oxoacid:acceptor oxidoreductase subunit alpha [Gemmataceae bacterium]
MASSKSAAAQASARPIEERDEVTVRFAGDSGDGMQLAGALFSAACAAAGNDISTLPDFPAEIRAPAGALAGVSGYQIHFSSHDIHTPGDVLNALVVMNPAALQANLRDLEIGGILVVNSDAFTPEDLSRAGYSANPLLDDSLAAFRTMPVPMNKLHREAVAQVKLSTREVERCRNFFALGLSCWIFDRPLEPTLRWIRDKFAANPAMLEANSRTLKAGYQHGEMTDLPVRYRVTKARIAPGKYRKITGNEALTLGLVTAARRAELPLVFACHPTTPASDVLHHMIEQRQHDVRILQAEDEAAALSMALGAAFAGGLGATATSGPGMGLLSEGLGLAVMSELPCVVVNIQRSGPSTGLPTKTEQADLLQALFGRHGEAPLPVLAAAHPSDCFAMALEAARLAIRHMTPVILLSDLYIANSAEPWKVPDVADLPCLKVERPSPGSNFEPYRRDERFVRPWAVPGAAGFEHRVGGLEKEEKTGHVNYDPANHEAMVKQRAAKITAIADDIPPLAIHGPAKGELLVLGWGGSCGAIYSAVKRAQERGRSVSCAFLRYLHPLPRNVGDVVAGFRRVLIPELNEGQLRLFLKSRLGIDAEGLCKVQGQPFLISEIEERILR